MQTLDGRWLSIDGRVLFKANVAASETYNTALEQHLRADLGRPVRRTVRTPTRRKRPVREIVGVDPRLNQRWSTRRADIKVRRGELAVQFQHDHGRPPTPVEALQLAQQATLETRRGQARTPHPWPSSARPGAPKPQQVLGGRRAVSAMVAHGPDAHGQPPHVTADAAWVAADGRPGPGRDGGTPRDLADLARPRRSATPASAPPTCAPNGRDALVDLLVDEVLRPADPCAGRRRMTASRNRSVLRRVDGSSVYTVAGADHYTSAADPGRRAAPGRRRRPPRRNRPSTAAAVELALLEMAANGTALDAGQAALVRDMCTSGARLQLAIAPAGAGKTTAMRALTPAWTQDGGQVIGLAPSAAAAAVLAEQTGIRTDTLAKLTWSLDHGELPDWAASDRPVDAGGHRRGRHGRHPHPRHRRPVRHRPRCECPADR